MSNNDGICRKLVTLFTTSSSHSNCKRHYVVSSFSNVEELDELSHNVSNAAGGVLPHMA